MSDLKGKIAIVTGANSGMGMATAQALSDKGATVIMLCRVNVKSFAVAYKKRRFSATLVAFLWQCF